MVEGAIESEEICRALAVAALTAKGAAVAIMDLRQVVDYTDMVLLVTARNRRHVQAIAEEVRRVARRDLGVQSVNMEGLTAGRWVLVDLGHLVVHIFEEPLRAFYNLDGLWSDAPRLPLPTVPGAIDDEASPGIYQEP